MIEKITEEEIKIYHALSDVYNDFLKLPVYFDFDTSEFASGINTLKNILLSRVAVRQLMGEGILDSTSPPEQKTIHIAIIGSRSINAPESNEQIYDFILSVVNFFETRLYRVVLLSGGARTGADHIAKNLSDDTGVEIIEYVPNWLIDGKLDKSAGYKRNVDVVKNSDIVFAFWDGQSKGTLHAINLAKQNNIPVIVSYEPFLFTSDVTNYLLGLIEKSS
jgi:hypothetical protein